MRTRSTRWSQKRRTGPASQRGTALVEFAFVAALLIFLVFGIMEMGFMMSNGITVSNAAQAGARKAALADATPAGGRARAVEQAVYGAAETLRSPKEFVLNSTNLVVEEAPEGTSDWIAWNPDNGPPRQGAASQVRVKVTYRYKYLTGSLLSSILGGKKSGDKDPGTRDLTAVSVMRYGG